MAHRIDEFEVGQRVVVVQQIPLRNRVYATRLAGRVIGFEQKKTGSWFAHAKEDRLWLDRLVVEKDDGEVVDFILDDYTHVELDPMPPPVSPAPPAADAKEPAEASAAAAGGEAGDSASADGDEPAGA